MRFAPVSYWYPTSKEWDTVLNATEKPPFALINPASGPGTGLDENYKGLSMELRNRKIRPVGYVSTLWGKRSSTDILAEIAAYVSWYGAQGVFFDECPNFWAADQAKHVAKYKALRDEIRTKYGSDFLIIHNPGTVPIRDMVPLADLHMSFESSATNYLTNGYYFPAWLSEVDGSKFWHVVYGVTDRALANRVVERAQELGVGTVMFTDRKHDPSDVDGNNAPNSDANNPYLTAPSPWLMALQEGNTVAERLILGPVLGYLGKRSPIHQMSVEATGYQKRAAIRMFDVPAGQRLIIIAYGDHGGNPWQKPSFQLTEEGSNVIRQGFPNFDTGSVAAGVDWRWGTSVDSGPNGRRFTLSLGNESPYNDNANRVTFKGMVMWAILEERDMVTETPFKNTPDQEVRQVAVTGALGNGTVHSLTNINVPAGQTWEVAIQGTVTNGTTGTNNAPRFNIGGVISDRFPQGSAINLTGTITANDPTVGVVTSSTASNTAVDFSGTVTITKTRG